MAEKIDTTNYYLVAASAGGMIVVLKPPRVPMTKDQSLNLAAWLVAVADDYDQHFARLLEAIQNT